MNEEILGLAVVAVVVCALAVSLFRVFWSCLR